MLKEEDHQSVSHVDTELKKIQKHSKKNSSNMFLEIRWIISWEFSNGFGDYGDGRYSRIPREFLNRIHLKHIFTSFLPGTILKMQF